MGYCLAGCRQRLGEEVKGHLTVDKTPCHRKSLTEI